MYAAILFRVVIILLSGIAAGEIGNSISSAGDEHPADAANTVLVNTIVVGTPEENGMKYWFEKAVEVGFQESGLPIYMG